MTFFGNMVLADEISKDEIMPTRVGCKSSDRGPYKKWGPPETDIDRHRQGKGHMGTEASPGLWQLPQAGDRPGVDSLRASEGTNPTDILISHRWSLGKSLLSQLVCPQDTNFPQVRRARG